MADFSGRGSRVEPAPSLNDRKPLVVDRDNFEDVLANLGVEVHVPLAADAAGRIVVPITELDDFHPDHLFESIGAFGSLRGLRRRLGNPTTFAAAAEEVVNWAKVRAPETPSPALEPLPTDPAALLEQMLGLAPSPRPENSVATDINAYIRSVVDPYTLAAPDPRQGQLEAAVDEAVAGMMRGLLHHPAFQEVEATWRGLDLVVRRLETDRTLKVHILDLTRAELIADLTESDDLRKSRLYKLLVEQTLNTPGGKPWAVVAGHFTFAPTPGDAALLQRLALLAQHAGAPFIAGGSPSLFGCASLESALDPDDWTLVGDTQTTQLWQALRQFPESRYLGLAAPRFLLRYPYGPGTNRTERFAFSELSEPPRHAEFLWGNPAVAVVLLLGQTFSATGWSMRPGQVQEMDGLPAVTYRADNETVLMPCAEVVLSERGREKLLNAGILPLSSVAQSDRVQVGPFVNMAIPQAMLAGRWSGK
jgi:type VI secretion system protein ImpC